MRPVEIYENIYAIGLSLYLKEHGVLVISDLHLGYEGSLHKRGVFVPKVQYTTIVSWVKDIIAAIEREGWLLRKVVLNGDVKHEFGRISEQEWREVKRFVRFLSGYEVVIVEGNHDPVLAPIARDLDLELVKHCVFGDILVVHGDEEIYPQDYGAVGIIVMGHEHPAVALEDGGRVEKYKCFLRGKYKGRVLIATPSFHPLTTGTDMLREESLSPLLKQDLGKFDVWIFGDEVLYFGKLGDL